MSPSPAPPNSPPQAAPLPPLPDLNSAGTPPQQPNSPIKDLVSGLGPVKAEVDNIMKSCKKIVQSGAVPGAEQVCSQIMALGTGLLALAAQSAMIPGQK